MRTNRRTWTTCTVLATILIAAVSVVGAQEQATVGDVLMKIATARNVEAATPADASSNLRARGFAVPASEFDQPLTEGRLVEIAGAFGIKVTTASPDAKIDGQQVDSFVSAFSTELSGNVESTTGDALGTDSLGNNGNGADPLEKGKGKKKGLRSPSDPA